MSQININGAIYEDFGKIKKTPLVIALEHLDSDQNLAVKAPIREGKTFAVCYAISKSNTKVLYVVRTHEQAKEVTKRLTALGVFCAHVAGVKWKNFPCNRNGYGLSWTPADLWQLLSKNKRKNIVEHVSQMLRDGFITAVVTVPQIAIHFEPEDFDILVLDEEQTAYWFKPESQLLFSYDRDFGRYSENRILEDAIPVVKKRFGKKAEKWVSWASACLSCFDMLRQWREEYKAQGEPHPEKKAMERLEFELNTKLLPYKWFSSIGDSKVIRAIEAVKRKPKLDDDLYEIYELVASTFAFYGFNAFTTKDGGRVWGMVDSDQLLFRKWLNGFKAIWLVLNKTSKADEWLFGKLNRDYKLITKDNFRFEPWFINTITNEPFKVAKYLYNRGTPTAWVVGRKRDAEKLMSKLDDYGIKAEIADRKSKEDIERLLLDGAQIILYLNSRVSKGIDLPMINVVFVHSYAFAVPDGSAIKTMRDELEQVILRCSPIDEDDPVPRMIIWCHKNERSKQEYDFVAEWLKHIEIPDGYDTSVLFKSNFLPLANISMLPNKISAKELEKKSPPFVFVESKTNTVPWSEIRRMLADGNHANVIVVNNLEVLKLPENASLLWYTLLKYANSEKEKGRFFGVNPESLDQFWEKVKGKTLTPTDVDRLFRAVGIRRNVIKSLLLNIMVRAGLLRKEKQGRRVKHCFANTDVQNPKVSDKVEVKDVKITKKRDPITGIVKSVVVSDAHRIDSNSGFIVDGFDLSPVGA